MKVPLKLEVRNRNLCIVQNKKLNVYEFPLLPYFYAMQKYNVNRAKITEETKTLLSNKKNTIVYKYEFSSMFDYKHAVDVLQNQITYLENYKTLLYINNIKFKECNEPDVLFFDIECETNNDGKFPSAQDKNIIAISTLFKNEKRIFSCYDMTEHDMLVNFLEYIKEINPDIISGYNIIRFDLPFIITRCILNNIDYNRYLNRDSSYIINPQKISFYGRIIYDLFLQCKADNKLRKIQNMKLKTVAEHFKLGTKIEIDFIKNIAITRKDEKLRTLFLEYAVRDVELCEKLFNIYYVSKYHLAEMLSISLDDAMNDYPSFIPNLFQARALYAQDYLPYRTNIDNAPSIVKARKNIGKLYQGAYVDIYKTGLFDEVHHIDYSSMYPNIMIAFNLSPENITLLEVKKFNDKFIFTKYENSIVIEMPDSTLDANLLIRINTETQSILSKELLHCYNERLKYKKLYKASHLESDNSKQNIFKLILNSDYGYNGATHARWGDMLIGILTTAIGRWLMLQTINFVKDIVIEVDTDGLYLTKQIDIDMLNAEITKILLNTGITKNYLFLEIDKYDGGYFYKQKNYILKKDGKFQYSGSSFTARSNCKIIKLAQQKIVEALFSKAEIDKIIKDIYDFKSYKLTDFSKDIRVREDLDSYKAKNPLAKTLAKQAIEEIGAIELHQLSYVRTKGKTRYKLLESATYKELDLQYYRDELDKLLEKFNLSRDTKLTRWLK